MSEPSQEAARTMEPADALRMLSRANDWLMNQLRQSKNCECGACYLCAFYRLEKAILERRQAKSSLAERDQRIAELEQLKLPMGDESAMLNQQAGAWSKVWEALTHHGIYLFVPESFDGKGVTRAVEFIKSIASERDQLRADLTAHMQLVKSMGIENEQLRACLREWYDKATPPADEMYQRTDTILNGDPRREAMEVVQDPAER